MTAKRRRDLKLCGLALAVMAVLAVVDVIALDVPWLRRLELLSLDAQIRLRGPQRAGAETVIVTIDERTIARLGWPVPRRKLAGLVALLHRAGAKVIGIDVLFADAEPVAAANVRVTGEPAGDAALSGAIGDAGNVVLPFTFTFGGDAGQAGPATKPLANSAMSPAVSSQLARAAYARLRGSSDYRPLALEPTGVVMPVAALAEAALLGHVLVAYDIDGAPRYDYPAFAYDLDHYPSMAVRVAQRFMGVPWNEVGVELGHGLALGPVRIPTDREMRLLVNYLGPPHTFPTYSLSQVLDGAVPDSIFANRIVLVGANALGTNDTFESPFTSVMPGVERLAMVIDSILHEHHLRRPDSQPWLEAAFMLVAALAIGIAMSRLSLASVSILAVALVAAVTVSGQVALARYGTWQAIAVPIIAIVLTFTALLFFRYGMLDKERRHIRGVFQRYLAPRMVDRLVSAEHLPELGGELRDLTVLFCDLRGFTALSERLDAATLTRLVNEFFAAASEAILEHDGTVDKYLGDAIMAFWNAPIDQPKHAALACRAALRILEKLDALNASLAREGDMPRLAVGIGINTGPCTVGNFGSVHRFDYSAIGDAVNVAARLEGETKFYGTPILIGPATAAQVGEFALLTIDFIQPRGRIETLEIHALTGDEKLLATAAFQALRSRHAQLRSAALAGDRETMQRCIDELMRNAPENLRPPYDAYARLAPWLRPLKSTTSTAPPSVAAGSR